MTYDPTMTPKQAEEAEKSTVTINVGVAKTPLERLKTFFSKVSFDKDTLKMFAYKMQLQLGYILQGLVGLITLTIYTPTLTYTANCNIAKQKFVMRRKLEEKQALEADGEEKSEAPSQKSDKSEKKDKFQEMEDWLKSYTED